MGFQIAVKLSSSQSTVIAYFGARWRLVKCPYLDRKCIELQFAADIIRRRAKIFNLDVIL